MEQPTGAGQAGSGYDPMRDAYGPVSGGLNLPSLGGPPGLLINAIEALGRMFSEGASEPDPASGGDPDRGELTTAGRAQQKHGDRQGSAFDPAKGTPQDKNAQGQSTLDGIVNSPDRINKPNRQGGTDVLESPGGRGARFGPDGKFTGFLEP